METNVAAETVPVATINYQAPVLKSAPAFVIYSQVARAFWGDEDGTPVYTIEGAERFTHNKAMVLGARTKASVVLPAPEVIPLLAAFVDEIIHVHNQADLDLVAATKAAAITIVLAYGVDNPSFSVDAMTIAANISKLEVKPV
jgi:hypothetical protein